KKLVVGKHFVVKGDCRFRTEEMDFAGQHGFRKLLQRRYIDDIHAASVGCRDEVRVAWMDNHVCDRDAWKILHESRPGSAAVNGEISGGFRPEKQQVSVLGIFANNPHRFRSRQIGADRGPSLTIVGAAENICVVVVAAMSIESQIDRTWIEA